MNEPQARPGSTSVDAATLREAVRSKYRDVALAPDASYHFHTGRPLAARLGYEAATVDRLSDAVGHPRGAGLQPTRNRKE